MKKFSFGLEYMKKVQRPILLKALNHYILYRKSFIIKIMTDNIKQNRELILKNPNLSANQLYNKSKSLGIGFRKTNFLGLVRDVRKLSEPSKIKREKSIPRIYRKVKPVKPSKPVKPTIKVKVVIPFEKTKFGKITKDLQKAHRISEKKAIIHARKILKIPKSDYHKINQKDVQILLEHTP